MSIFDDIGNIIGKFAPMLGTALGGPLGGMAGKFIATALGTDPEAPPEDIQKALLNASPEQIAALKKAEQDFTLRMTEMGFKNTADLEQIAAADRASARAREVTVKDNTPKYLAYGYAIGFFLTLAAIIALAVYHIQVEEGIKSSLDMLLGVEVGMILGAKEYYFGSSSGSKTKDETIASMSK